ncbi:long-chain-fatty-acid--CoA ligase [Acanthopleuribacter pedis]|uniref:Long-chain-fatty-acid--CoA ligase n=1 Tax=Acanthopleuribacter pedis TaxID=442870 RepID=A0A8J7U1A1_9BACT|nr:long-chain-fatty-acid--CoA ligase [Acanthopleuribacter pedis]MBO1317958.1 long-chain-fatty-acid--CoA ligase [Acanthopleuribacter pedis]
MYQTLCQVLTDHVSRQPEAVAFFDGDHRISYTQFEASVAEIAAGLQAMNLPPASRIAYLADDHTTAYALLFACARLGHVFMPLNQRLSAEELHTLLDHAQAALLFTQEAGRKRLRFVLPRLANLHTITLSSDRAITTFQTKSQPVAARSGGDGGQACVQLYTSGTTGRPKGVVLPERCFFAITNAMRAQGDPWMGLQNHDRLLLSLPVFHIGGMWWAVQGLVAGAAGALLPRFSAGAALQAIQQHRISQVAMVPAMLHRVLSEPEGEQTDLISVKGLLYGGSPMRQSLMAAIQARLGCRCFQMYGMTETGNMAVCQRPEEHQPDNPGRRFIAGRALPGASLKIVLAKGDEAAVGQVGEVWIHSPAAMLGYHRDAEATAATLVDGWVRSGDMGFVDEDGFLTLCDRLKDMIIYAGEKIFPAEIEAVLTQHGAVAEAAVIGVPDPRWGESVKAFVVRRPDTVLRKRDLLAFAKQQLADFKVPKSVDFVESLPRNASGRILKRALRAPYWAGQSRQVH